MGTTEYSISGNKGGVANLSLLFELNYLPLGITMAADLKKWRKECFSWFSRNSILKKKITLYSSDFVASLVFKTDEV